MTRIWSSYQQAIFDEVELKSGNILVEACPGSGKTTVIEEAIKRVPRNETVLAMAFNRHIRDELRSRLEHLPNVTVHTLNSFGNSLLSGWYKINARKVSNILRYDVLDLSKGNYTKEKWKLFIQLARPVERLMGICKGHMVFTVEDLKSNWERLANEYDIEAPEDIDFFKYLLEVFEIDQKKTKVLDYDDQIAIPLRKGTPIPQFDRVCVDEAQDLNPAKTALASGAIRGCGYFVGDRKQSVYHFAGASSDSMDKILMELDAKPMPLSICYRCAKAIVRRAQQVFPDIEAWEGAPEGVEETISVADFRSKAAPGDVVLCRCTAPVVQAALWFIRNGIKAVVKGREIGKDLCDLIENLSQSDVVEDFLETLRVWYEAACEKCKEDDKQAMLDDKYETIRCVSLEFKSVQNVLNFFKDIFGDDDRT